MISYLIKRCIATKTTSTLSLYRILIVLIFVLNVRKGSLVTFCNSASNAAALLWDWTLDRLFGIQIYVWLIVVFIHGRHLLMQCSG